MCKWPPVALLLDSTDLEAGGQQLCLTTVGIPAGPGAVRWERDSEKLNWGETLRAFECQNKGTLEITEGV